MNRALWALEPKPGIHGRLIALERSRQGKRELKIHASCRMVSGDPEYRARSDELVVVGVVRDGADYAEQFVRHYLALGVAKIILLDNGSTDETQQKLAGRPEVILISCELPFAQYKNDLRNYLVSRFCTNGWVIVADIDELLDFPGRGPDGLAPLLSYLDSRGFGAVVTQLLDLFPAGEIELTRTRNLVPSFATCRFFDLSGIRSSSHPSRQVQPSIRVLRGGIRSRLGCPEVLLTKHALFRNSSKMLRIHHWIHGASIADLSVVLLHYKFLPGFGEKVAEAVRACSYHDGSREYRAYQRSLPGGGRLSLHDRGSCELDAIEQLAQLGFLAKSESQNLRA